VAGKAAAAGTERIFAGSSDQAAGQSRLFYRHWISFPDHHLADSRSDLDPDSAESSLRSLLSSPLGSSYPEIISMNFKYQDIRSFSSLYSNRCSESLLFIGISISTGQVSATLATLPKMFSEKSLWFSLCMSIEISEKEKRSSGAYCAINVYGKVFTLKFPENDK